MVREISGVDCDIVVREPGWKPEYTGNNERLLKEVGDFRFTGFKETIRSLCKFYESNIDRIDADRLI